MLAHEALRVCGVGIGEDDLPGGADLLGPATMDHLGGEQADARVAVTGVGTKPSLARGSMEALIGSDGSEDAVAAAAARATEGITVLEDLYGSEEYKAHLATVYVGRAVTAALSRS